MATYLFCWELGAGAGHCVNLLPIASRLSELGHHVFVAARDLNIAGRVLGHLPIKLLAAPVLTGRVSNPFATPRTFAHILHNTGFADDQQLETLLCAWRNLFELIRPAVVVCEHSPLALLASRQFNVQRALIGTGFFSPPDRSPFDDLRPWMKKAPDEIDHTEEIVLERINRVLSRSQLTPLVRVTQFYGEVDENFLLTYAELDHYKNREHAVYWGMWSPKSGELPRWPDVPGKRLFAYLKPPLPVWDLERFLHALAENGPSSIAYIPGATSEWMDRQMRRFGNLFLTNQPIDMQEVSQSCDVAVMNGNAGTSTQLLLAGIPQLHVPIYLEQTLFSLRVSGMHAGILVDSTRHDLFAIAIDQLLSDVSYTEGAKRFSNCYSRYDSAAAIEQIVSRLVRIS